MTFSGFPRYSAHQQNELGLHIARLALLMNQKSSAIDPEMTIGLCLLIRSKYALSGSSVTT